MIFQIRDPLQYTRTVQIARSLTKRKILDAALRELIDKGFVGFTIQGVAARTNISLGNLTYHFPTRERLIQAMIDQWFENWKIAFSQVINKKIGEKRPDIKGFIEWVMDYALIKKNVRTFTELWAIGNHEPKVARMLDKLYEQAANTVIAALGFDTCSQEVIELRNLLYVLAAVSEGSTAVLGNSTKNHVQRKLLKQSVLKILTPHFEATIHRSMLR